MWARRLQLLLPLLQLCLIAGTDGDIWWSFSQQSRETEYRLTVPSAAKDRMLAPQSEPIMPCFFSQESTDEQKIVFSGESPNATRASTQCDDHTSPLSSPLHSELPRPRKVTQWPGWLRRMGSSISSSIIGKFYHGTSHYTFLLLPVGNLSLWCRLRRDLQTSRSSIYV